MTPLKTHKRAHGLRHFEAKGRRSGKRKSRRTIAHMPCFKALHDVRNDGSSLRRPAANHPVRPFFLLAIILTSFAHPFPNPVNPPVPLSIILPLILFPPFSSFISPLSSRRRLTSDLPCYPIAESSSLTSIDCGETRFLSPRETERREMEGE